MASFLITVGIIALTLGLIAYVGDSRTPGGEAHSRPLTLLPGDIKYESPNGSFRFYFPIVTCLVVSVVASLILWLMNR